MRPFGNLLYCGGCGRRSTMDNTVRWRRGSERFLCEECHIAGEGPAPTGEAVSGRSTPPPAEVKR